MEAAGPMEHQQGIMEAARGNEEARVIGDAWAKVRHAARKAKRQAQVKGKGGAKRMREVHEAMRIDRDVRKVKTVAREIKAAERASESAQLRMSKIDTDSSDEDADKSIGSWHKKKGADTYHGLKLGQASHLGAKAHHRRAKTAAALKATVPTERAKPTKTSRTPPASIDEQDAIQREARINSGWKKILKSKMEIKKAMQSQSKRKKEEADDDAKTEQLVQMLRDATSTTRKPDELMHDMVVGWQKKKQPEEAAPPPPPKGGREESMGP
jgi:hypothetical protein